MIVYTNYYSGSGSGSGSGLYSVGRGVPRIWEGGGQEFFFFSDLGICIIARGVRGHAPPRKFFKTVQFGAF